MQHRIRCHFHLIRSLVTRPYFSHYRHMSAMVHSTYGLALSSNAIYQGNDGKKKRTEKSLLQVLYKYTFLYENSNFCSHLAIYLWVNDSPHSSLLCTRRMQTLFCSQLSPSSVVYYSVTAMSLQRGRNGPHCGPTFSLG